MKTDKEVIGEEETEAAVQLEENKDEEIKEEMEKPAPKEKRLRRQKGF